MEFGIIEAKFKEDEISKILLELAERFAVDGYAYVKYLKGHTRSDTLDVVVLLDRKPEVADHLYDALNYRMGESNKIPTFFRSQDKQSFMFPGGVNIHFTDKQKFLSHRHRWTVIGGVCEAKFMNLFRPSLTEVDWKINWVLVLTDNPYYSFDKEHADFWNKSAKAKTYDL